MDRSNFTAGLCQHHNNTLARPGSPGPNPITHPCDTETDSDPDPELDPVRKGSRLFNLTSPTGPGKPPAKGAVTFSTNLSGWVGSMLCSLLSWGYFQ